MKKFWDIFALVKNYKGYLYANIFFNLLNALLSLFTFIAVAPFLRILFHSGEAEPAPYPSTVNYYSGDYYMDLIRYHLDSLIQTDGRETALLYMVMGIVVIALLKNLVLYFSLFSLSTIRVGVSKDLREKIYRKVLRLPLAFYSEEKKGDMLSRMTNDLMEIEFSVIGTLEILFKSPMQIVIFLASLFMMSWELTLFAMFFLPTSGYFISRMAKSLKGAAERGKSKLGELITLLDETLGGLRIIKAFNGEKVFNRKFDRYNSEYFHLMVRLYKREYLSSPTSEFIGITVVSVLLWYGGNLVFKGEGGLTGEFFIAYLIVFSQIISPAKALTEGLFRMSKGAASIDRVNDILHAHESIGDKPNALDLPAFEREIEYENISFAYNTEQVLDGVSFKLKKGETLALVGPSGGGKSTLANLLPRFYDVTSGALKVDGLDIRDVKIEDLRALLGVVSQESILFNDSILNNITMGEENPDRSRVEKAAEIANAMEFIKDLPRGLDSNIGDGGGKLSGGQKQRLSIARAIYKNPPILILDEATSALDTRSEKLVQEAIEHLMEGRTVLVIAHRLSTIQNAHRIVVIKGGKVIESGTHESLMQTKGMYHSLVEMQGFN